MYHSSRGHPGQSGYSTSERSPHRPVSPLGSSRFEHGTRYHSRRETFEVRPQVDLSRRRSELAQLHRTQTISGLSTATSRHNAGSRHSRSGFHDSRGANISGLGRGHNGSSAGYIAYQSREAARRRESAFPATRYPQASASYRPSAEPGRGHRSSANAFRDDVWLPSSLRAGPAEPRGRYDERSFQASSPLAGHRYGHGAALYQTRTLAPDVPRRRGALRRSHREGGVSDGNFRCWTLGDEEF